MKRIGVFTSGGDAPGMNACLRAVVRAALFNGLEVYGIKRGYNGMISGDIAKMSSSSVSGIIQKGGTLLKSARSDEFLTVEGKKKAYEQLQKHGIEGLVALGGNGTFTGAKAFFEKFGVPVIGAPCTIDNDLYGTDYTIGYDTAVNTALDAIDKIRDTADSHDRVFFIEVMGRDSGYIAVPCAIGGGAEVVMIPESQVSIPGIISSLEVAVERSKTSSIVIIAEGEIEGGASRVAEKVREAMPHLDARVTIIGHVQRGGAPTALDRMLASRLGIACVKGLLEGRSNVMAGIISEQLVYTPFAETISRKKTISSDFVELMDILTV